MVVDFERYALKGNEFLHQLEANLGNEDRAHAGRILKSTFAVLRNHLTVEDSLLLLQQLPGAIKSVYVDGWSLKDHYRIDSPEDFVIEMVEAEGKSAWRDFSSMDEVTESARAVIETMRLYVPEEELDRVLNSLPDKVRRALVLSEKENN